MNILLIRSKAGIRYASHIRDYILSQGMDCHVTDILSVEDFIREKGLNPSNTLIYSRTAGPETNKKIAEIERAGFTVINSVRTLELTSNKYLAQIHAEECGIPIAKTYKVKKADLKKIRELAFMHQSVVLKPIFSQGQGIFCQKVTAGIAEESLKTILDLMPGDEIQVQQFIDYEMLIRVIVINFKAIREATTYDFPGQKDWKCSVCLNSKIKKYRDFADDLFVLAEKTARDFNAKINFIDFFKDMKGNFILNEINTSCSLFLHEAVSGVRINELIGDFLIAQTSKLVQ